VPFHRDGVISQFEGYEELRELDWDDYRKRYGNIQRLDLILESEGDSANRYKASKQADVLMLLYVFSTDELRDLLGRIGYALEPDAVRRTVAYYTGRTSHGSTLSRVVHAWVLARSDRSRALRFFAEALQSDVGDIQQGTTAEGVHLGAMAGTVDLVGRVSTGLEVTGDVLRLDPRLPRELDRLEMRIRYRGHALDLRLTRDALTIHERDRGPAPISLRIRDQAFQFEGGGTRVFPLST
jgi:trehalose/maltose hydrolase-like predicted phosphorylase